MYGYIYKTTNLITGRIYIGKKKGLFDKNYFGSGRYLLNAVNKYGKSCFKVEVIEYCETLETQNNREVYWISYYRNSNADMYNISNGGDGGDVYSGLSDEDKVKWRDNNNFCQGQVHKRTPEEQKVISAKIWKTRRLNGTDKMTEEQIIHQRKVHLGYKHTDKSKEKIGNRFRGIPLSDEHKEKLRSSNKGKKRSAESKARIKEGINRYVNSENYVNPFKGKHHTEKTKQLLSEYNKMGICGNKGKKFTDEHKEKISSALKGRIVSEETKEKLRKANKGQVAHNTGKRCYNNGSINIYLNPDTDIIPEGFVLGGKGYSKRKE